MAKTNMLREKSFQFPSFTPHSKHRAGQDVPSVKYSNSGMKSFPLMGNGEDPKKNMELEADMQDRQGNV